ncbi:hypothetical protein Q3G72_014056 [Acer saccharum]|nr:hypothetical protein Q3G72_014056 [Acer saccharum]
MVNGMHVYGWPILSKVASYGWSKRRIVVAKHPKFNGAHGGFGGRRFPPSSAERGIKTARKILVIGPQPHDSKRSFVEVVDGKAGLAEEEKVVTFIWKGQKEGDGWLRKCAVGVLNRFSSISRVNNHLEERDFAFSSTFLGGRRILWQFESEVECEGLIRNSFFWTDCFRSMEKWSDMLKYDVRTVWVDLWGIPLSCWNKEFFYSLGRSLGDPLLLDEDTLRRRRLDRGRMLVALPLDKTVPNKIKSMINGEVVYVALVEDKNPMSSGWINEFLELKCQLPNSNISPETEAFIHKVGVDNGKGYSHFEAYKVGVLGEEAATCQGGRILGMEGKVAGQQRTSGRVKDCLVGNLNPDTHILSGGNMKIDKGKGSWVKKAMKPRTSYDRSAKIDLEKRLSEVGGKGFSKSSSSDSTFLGWKGECSRRQGPRRKCVEFLGVLGRHSEVVLSKDNGSQAQSPSDIPSEGTGPSEDEDSGEEGECANWVLQEGEEGEMLVKLRNDGLEEILSAIGSDTEGSTQENGSKYDTEEGLLKPLDEYASAKIGEIKLNVVLPTPRPKSRKKKSIATGSKMHGMRTRRDKHREKDMDSDSEIRREGRESENRENLDVARTLDFNSKTTGSGNLEEEVSKVLETGKAVGFDFQGREKVLAEQLMRREREDEARLNDVR